MGERMTKNRFLLLYLSPYILIVLSLFVGTLAGPLIYRGLTSPEELRIAEFPYRLDLPEIRRPFIPPYLKSPFRVPKRAFPSVPLQEIAPPPSSPSGEVTVEPKITLVFVSEGFRIAIINSLLLKEGDSLGRAIILRIREDAVVLSEGGRIREIPVP